MSHMKQDEVRRSPRRNRAQGCQRLLQHPLEQAALRPRRETPRRPWRVCCRLSRTPSATAPRRSCWCRADRQRHQAASPTTTAFSRSVAEIRKAVPLAQELGVKIAIENVWNDFITKPEQAKAFLDAIDSPMVGWHFDIGNVLRYGPPEDWIPVLGKRILKLHIKEYSQFKKFSVPLLGGRQPLAGHHEGPRRGRLQGLGHFRTTGRTVPGPNEIPGAFPAHGQGVRELSQSATKASTDLLAGEAKLVAFHADVDLKQVAGRDRDFARANLSFATLQAWQPGRRGIDRLQQSGASGAADRQSRPASRRLGKPRFRRQGARRQGGFRGGSVHDEQAFAPCRAPSCRLLGGCAGCVKSSPDCCANGPCQPGSLRHQSRFRAESQPAAGFLDVALARSRK